MMKKTNELAVFQNDQFGSVRVIEREGEPWFVAADVCRALEIGNSRMATDRLDEDEKAAVSLTDTSSNGVVQQREMTIINESGLYTLVLGSRKPEAKAFKRWITHEVIPSIRKHGEYKLQSHRRQMRIAGITIRRSLTDAIKLSGEDERMHGNVFSTYTNLVYKMALGKTTKQLKKEYGHNHPREVMTAEELEKVAAIERVVVDMLMLGLNYQQIKPLLEQMTVVPQLPAA